ncbi:MAG: DUF305 domain-containing protein [bacterium]
MNRSSRATVLAGLLGVATVAGCSSAIQQSTPPAPSAESPRGPSATSGQSNGQVKMAAALPYTAADVHFMAGMIPHHAQAVLIAGWAPTHGARADVRTLCERIVVAQRDEIALMQLWLKDRHETVPDANATHMTMKMDGMKHDMLMPGMLTDAELATLDAARGPAFDRIFLQAMIRHHQGAISMVDELSGAYGARQDEVVFRFSSDVYADQTTEIERMQKMLAATPGGGLEQ